MNYPIIIFSLFSLLFFIVSLYAGNKLRIVFFNIIFLILCYFSISMLLGEAKPISNILLYNHANWDDRQVYVVGGWWDKKNIYLMVKENDKIRTYNWVMTKEFLDRIKKANAEMSARSGGDRWGFSLRNGGDGLDTTTPSVVLPAPQDDHPVPKPLEPDTSQIHHYEVN